MLEIIFSIVFFFSGGALIDTKLKAHKYDKDDYKEIFYLKYNNSITKYCINHSEEENITKKKHHKPGGGQETHYKVTQIIGSETRTQYWNNGQILSQISYLKGKRDGSCRNWYKNGQLMNEGFYKNGKMIGYWISYYENGQIQSHGNYKYANSTVYSRKTGVWKYYYDNGKLESESIIKNGVEELKFYNKEGKLILKGEEC